MKSKLRKTNIDFINEMHNKNSNIEIIDTYVNNYTKILVKCKKCNYEWETLPLQLLDGHGCPECWKISKRLTENEFLKRVKKYNGDNIKVLEKYKGILKYYSCECNVCGFKWRTSGGTLINGHGCPKCSFSHGEKEITKILDKYDIKYISQYKFSGLKGIGNRLLSYDFYLPDYNLLIEFQGRQHEIPIEYFGGEKQFEIQQEHDKRKREYAESHNINLLEIWYYDEPNIEEILTKKINNLKSKSLETVIPA